MAEYKGKLLKGLFTQAKNILMSDGTDVATEINGIKNNAIKRTQTTLTTNADGYVTVPKSTYPHIINVCAIDSASLAFVYQANAGEWVVWFKSAATYTPTASSNIVVDIFYTN